MKTGTGEAKMNIELIWPRWLLLLRRQSSKKALAVVFMARKVVFPR